MNKPINNPRPCLHFVGFSTADPWQYLQACVIFGTPEYLHDRWDVRAEQEWYPGDTIVYANNTPRRAEEREEFQRLTRLNHD